MIFDKVDQVRLACVAFRLCGCLLFDHDPGYQNGPCAYPFCPVHVKSYPNCIFQMVRV
jgi:hypothetical protein